MTLLHTIAALSSLSPVIASAHDMAFHEEEMRKILASGDPAACVRISESELVDDCFLQFARAEDDPEICRMNPDQRGAFACSALIEGSPGLCAALSDSDDAAYCFTTMAREMRDSDLCDRISKDFGYDRCVTEVADVTGDVSLCEGLRDTESSLTSVCLSRVASRTRDVTLCDRIESLSMTKGCIRDVAVALGDTTLCERIGDMESMRYYGCLVRIAVDRKDIAVCDPLPRERQRRCENEALSVIDPDRLVERDRGRADRMRKGIVVVALLLVAAGTYVLRNGVKRRD